LRTRDIYTTLLYLFIVLYWLYLSHRQPQGNRIYAFVHQRGKWDECENKTVFIGYVDRYTTRPAAKDIATKTLTLSA